MTALVFIDGDDLRAAEIRQIIGVELVVEPLTSGFATSAPEPEHKARDKVLAHATTAIAFAEAVDLLKDGTSLRLELDSGTANRFCKWWRETAVTMELRVALRTGEGAVRVFAASCAGQIADRPAGPSVLGWDRLFVPAGATATLAESCERGEPSALRVAAYGELAGALGLPRERGR